MMATIVNVENAETPTGKVIIEVWQEDVGRKEDISDSLLETFISDKPSDLQNFIVFPGRYLMIKAFEDPEGNIEESEEEA
jgi:hypothetical protein